MTARVAASLSPAPWHGFVGAVALVILLGGCGGGGTRAGAAEEVAASPPPSTAPAPPAASWPLPASIEALGSAMDAPAAVPGASAPPVSSLACQMLGGPPMPKVSGTANPAVVPSARPGKGVAFVDPAFGTCVVRVTRHDAEAPAGFARNDYSRRQAFNADSSLQLVYALDGAWHVYDSRTLAWVQRLNGPAGDAEPQWHPTDPKRLVYLPTNGNGMQVLELDLASGLSRTVGALGDRLRQRWPTAAAAWTRSEGSPSADGRHWCFLVEDAAFRSLGIVTWDRETDTVLGWFDTGGRRPDHLSMSPSGGYCVVSWDDGVVAFDRTLTRGRALGVRGEHSDIAIDTQGQDVYVAVDYDATGGPLFMLRLSTGERTNLLDTYLDGTATALHVSGKAYRKPGWVIVSTYAAYLASTGGKAALWPHAKVMAVQLRASPRIVQLAHTQTADAGYWTEPQASINRDGTKVVFTSNWNVASDTDVDAYLVELPAGALD